MKYGDQGQMISAHIGDMVESGYDDSRCINTAFSTVLTLLYMAHNNDEEKVIEALDHLNFHAKQGIDAGALKEFRSMTVN